MGALTDTGGNGNTSICIPVVHQDRPPHRHRQGEAPVPETVEVERPVQAGQPRHELERRGFGDRIGLQPGGIDDRSCDRLLILRTSDDRKNKHGDKGKKLDHRNPVWEDVTPIPRLGGPLRDKNTQSLREPPNRGTALPYIPAFGSPKTNSELPSG